VEITMHIAVIGAGPAGLFLGSALARRGHRVTAVERDAGPPLGTTWERRGVMQFHHAHAFRSTVVDSLERELPEAVLAWLATGAEPITVDIEGRQTLIGYRSRRESFERALREVAAAMPGLTIRQGHVDAVLADGGRASGLLVDGARLDADLVVDASGRAGRVTRPLGERVALGGPCGQAYVDRVYRLRPGAAPGPMTNPVVWQSEHDGYLALVFLHDQGFFSALIVRRDDDRVLRGLRDTTAFEQAAAAIPGLSDWTDPERAVPVTDVLAGGALLNVYAGQRRPSGGLVLPGLFFVGDSVATTTPVFGRGLTTTLQQGEALLRLLDHDPQDPEGAGHALDDFGEAQIRPWVEDHVLMDVAHVQRWSGAELDVDAPLPSDLILAAAEVRPEIMRFAPGYLSMHALPASLRQAEEIAREVYASGWRPAYADGPTRDELAEIVTRATAAVSSR
jgi:2-polyprenyl-6-methoxyphenol hydroxylase-like FAD-dependent oxidoreductase